MSFFCSWPSLAISSAASLAVDAFAFVSSNKAANLAVQGGLYCSNQTLEANHQAFCDSSYDSYDYWNTFGKVALIGLPVCLAVTVSGLVFRYLERLEKSQEGGEARPIVAKEQARPKSFCVKTADFFSSTGMQITYMTLALASSVYPMPGSYFLNRAAFKYGANQCSSGAAKASYIALKALLNTALGLEPLSYIALGASYVYNRAKPKEPIIPEVPMH